MAPRSCRYTVKISMGFAAGWKTVASAVTFNTATTTLSNTLRQYFGSTHVNWSQFDLQLGFFIFKVWTSFYLKRLILRIVCLARIFRENFHIVSGYWLLEKLYHHISVLCRNIDLIYFKTKTKLLFASVLVRLLSF